MIGRKKKWGRHEKEITTHRFNHCKFVQHTWFQAQYSLTAPLLCATVTGDGETYGYVEYGPRFWCGEYLWPGLQYGLPYAPKSDFIIGSAGSVFIAVIVSEVLKSHKIFFHFLFVTSLYLLLDVHDFLSLMLISAPKTQIFVPLFKCAARQNCELLIKTIRTSLIILKATSQLDVIGIIGARRDKK